jgi:hypothetical protein
MRCENVIPIKDFGEGGQVGGLALRDAGGAEPKRLNQRCSNQIRGFWPERTQASYLPWNLSVEVKSGRFSGDLNGNRPSDQGLGPRNPSMLPPVSRLNSLAKSRRPKVRRSGWDACATQRLGRMAVQRPRTSRLPLEVKSDTCLPFQANMLLKAGHLKNDLLRKPSCC